MGDRRIREEILGDNGSNDTSSRVPNQLWSNQVQCLGHCWSGEVWGSSRCLLPGGTVCHNNVRPDFARELQECPQLAQGRYQSRRKHSHRPPWEQGGHRTPECDGQDDHVSPKQEHSVLRRFGQGELQLRKTVSLASQETG